MGDVVQSRSTTFSSGHIMSVICIGGLRCAGGSPDKTVGIPQMPKANRRSWKDEGRTHRGLPAQRRMMKKGRHIYSPNLVSDRGQEHGFEGVRKENHEVLICWRMGWLLFPMSDWFQGERTSISMSKPGSFTLFMAIHKSFSYSSSTCAQQCLTLRVQDYKVLHTRRILWNDFILN